MTPATDANTEIEVTPGMIEAGVSALEGYLIEDALTDYSRFEAVREVFLAMRRAAKTERPSRSNS
jgi:hypothetical protein